MEELFVQTVEFLVNGFESFITVEFVTKMNETKYRGRKKYIAAGITFLLLMVNAEIFYYMEDFSEFMTYIGLIIIFIYSMVALTGRITYRFFLCVTIIFVIVGINFLILLIFSVIFNVRIEELMNEFNIYRFACLITTKIILFVVTRILLKLKTEGISTICPITVVSVTAVPLITIAVMVISVGYNIMCSLDNCMEDDDLVSLLGNVLDNAMEACEHVQRRKEIYLEVKKARSYLLLTVKNTISKPVLNNNPELKSTKEDKINHGFGIKNVKKIVEKYNGFVTYDEKDDKFICKTMLLV